MRKSMLCAAALMLMAGAAVGMFARGYTAGRVSEKEMVRMEATGLENSEREAAGILTPAKDEQLASSDGASMIIDDDAVPLAPGPGSVGVDTGVVTEYLQPADQENPYIRQVVDLVNEERVKAGMTPLEKSDEISLAAGVRAGEIISAFSHTRPDGTSYRTALEQRGIAYRVCGENVAYGYSTPEAVMSAWMDSEGHKANILNQDYTSIGVGYVKDSRGLGYWTQLFTTKR